MNVSILTKLGLNEKELKVYLNLLQNGPSSVRQIADNVNLNRGTVYDILKKMQGLSIISFYHQASKQKFVAESPDVLLKLIEEKEADIQTAKIKISKIIPELKSLQDKQGNKPVTKFYEGTGGVKAILDDVLISLEVYDKKEYYVYSAKNASEDINKAYPDFTEKRIKNKISVKSISLAQGGGLHGLDERKWLGTNDESATFIILYAGKCAFLSRDSIGEPVGVIIENEMIYKTQKIIFLSLWDLIKTN